MVGVDQSGIMVGVLMATVLLRVALVAAAVWWIIPRRARCPHCGHETAALISPRGLALVGLTRRWCWSCGWTGLSKALRSTPLAGTAARSEARSVN